MEANERDYETVDEGVNNTNTGQDQEARPQTDDPPPLPPRGRAPPLQISLDNMREITTNDGSKWVKQTGTDHQSSFAEILPTEDVPRQPRLTYTDVKEDISRAKMENVFGKTEFGRSVYVEDITQNPIMMMREASLEVNKVNKALSDPEAKKAVGAWVFKQVGAQMGNIALHEVQQNRYLRDEFDSNPDNYKIDVSSNIITTDRSGGNIVRQVLHSFYSTESQKHLLRDRNDLVRKLIVKALNDLNRDEQDTNMEMLIYHVNHQAAGDNQEAIAQLESRHLVTKTDRVRQIRIREALLMEQNRLQSREVIDLERDEDRRIDQRKNLLNSESARRTQKRPQMELPQFGVRNVISIDMRKLMLQTYQAMPIKFEGPESGTRPIQEYLDHCRTLINGVLSPRAAFDVLTKMSKPDSMARAYLEARLDTIHRNLCDPEEVFRSCWYNVQLWADEQNKDDSIRRQLAYHINHPPDYADALFPWTCKVAGLVQELYKEKDEKIANEYIIDNFKDIVHATLAINWEHKITSIEAIHDDWFKAEDPKKLKTVWDHADVWKKCCLGANLHIKKSKIQTYDEPGTWVEQARLQRNRKLAMRKEAAMAGGRSSSSQRKSTRKTQPQARVQEISEVKDLPVLVNEKELDAISNAGSRTSKRSRGRKTTKRPTGVCHKCGEKGHMSTKCNLYGHRTELLKEPFSCEHCSWFHSGECRTKGPKAGLYVVDADLPVIHPREDGGGKYAEVEGQNGEIAQLNEYKVSLDGPEESEAGSYDMDDLDQLSEDDE